MSGQCLSPSEPDHALTPGTHLSLGRPLPHQQTSRTQTALRVINLWSGDIIRYYPQFPMAIPNPKVRIYALLSLSPLSPWKQASSVLARLACLIHAANVHSEPGSNPSIIMLTADSNSITSRKTSFLKGSTSGHRCLAKNQWLNHRRHEWSNPCLT